jgi:hypothetical protein
MRMDARMARAQDALERPTYSPTLTRRYNFTITCLGTV